MTGVRPRSAAAAVPEASRCPRGAGAMYLLVSPLGSHGSGGPIPPGLDGDATTGWTLMAGQGTAWWWAASLAAHGAGDLAEARVAKAVALRVLADRGVVVLAWNGGRWGNGDIVVFWPSIVDGEASR